MKTKTGWTAAVAAIALLGTAAAAAQGYGYDPYGYWGNGAYGYGQPYYPRGYMGDHRWCLYRGGTLGNTALCSYRSYRECMAMILDRRGSCIVNPDYAEGIPPPQAGGPPGGR